MTCSVCGATDGRHCIDSVGRVGPGSLVWPAGHNDRHRYLRAMGGSAEVPGATTHRVTVSHNRIECTLDCPELGGHISEYRALNVQGG